MTDTTIRRAAFGTIEDALAFARAALDDGGVAGCTVQILGGSSAWPDPGRRYRVTAAVDHGLPNPRGVE